MARANHSCRPNAEFVARIDKGTHGQWQESYDRNRGSHSCHPNAEFVVSFDKGVSCNDQKSRYDMIYQKAHGTVHITCPLVDFLITRCEWVAGHVCHWGWRGGDLLFCQVHNISYLILPHNISYLVYIAIISGDHQLPPHGRGGRGGEGGQAEVPQVLKRDNLSLIPHLLWLLKYLRYRITFFFNPYFLIAFDTFFSSQDFLWVSVHLSGLYTSGKLILKKCDKEATTLLNVDAKDQRRLKRCF